VPQNWSGKLIGSINQVNEKVPRANETSVVGLKREDVQKEVIRSEIATCEIVLMRTRSQLKPSRS
jgi:hypothetical protein